MLESERKYIARQNNYNKVPHPLMEGLVHVGWGPISRVELEAFVHHMHEMCTENELVKVADSN